MCVRKYSFWQKAHKAIIETTPPITNTSDYAKRCRQDRRLLVDPQYYFGFPGWDRYLGVSKYQSWQEASLAVRAIKEINSPTSYVRFHRLDPRLPHNPQRFYEDFPGWEIFLFGEEAVYGSWQEASKAAIVLDIVYKSQYKPNFKRDPKLPRHPDRTYADFPGWDIFLGKNKL